MNIPSPQELRQCPENNKGGLIRELIYHAYKGDRAMCVMWTILDKETEEELTSLGYSVTPSIIPHYVVIAW